MSLMICGVPPEFADESPGAGSQLFVPLNFVEKLLEQSAQLNGRSRLCHRNKMGRRDGK
jgi:hypothetical protein